MEAIDKAKELVSIYWNAKVETPHVRESIMSKELAIQCALIAVDEIIKSNPCYEDSDRGGNFTWNDNTYYWQEVKTEIEKL